MKPGGKVRSLLMGLHRVFSGGRGRVAVGTGYWARDV
jgi:hypothetical protein